MTPADRRASEASRLLSEPLLNEALDIIERDTVEEILRCWWFQDRKRRVLADRISVIRGIRGHLRSVVLTGKEGERARPTVV